MVISTVGRGWHTLGQPHAPLCLPGALRCAWSRPFLLLLLQCCTVASHGLAIPGPQGAVQQEEKGGAGQHRIQPAQMRHHWPGARQWHVGLGAEHGAAPHGAALWQNETSLDPKSAYGKEEVAALARPCTASAVGVQCHIPRPPHRGTVAGGMDGPICGTVATHRSLESAALAQPTLAAAFAPGLVQQQTGMNASVWGERRVLRQRPATPRLRRAQRVKVVKVWRRQSKKRSPPPRPASASKPPLPTSRRQPISLRTPPSCPKLLPFPENPKTGSIDKALVYSLCLRPERAKKAIGVTVYRESTGVTWKGFGTTLGGMGAHLGSLDAKSMDCVADLLFHTSRGLGLNIVRYNIPGGYNPAYSPKLARDPLASRGFWPKPGAGKEVPRFNATADPFQRRFLKKAKGKGVAVFEAIAYSPPWWMTRSNDTRGAGKKGLSNLHPDHVHSFAKYLAAVVSYLNRTLGIRFSSLAPFNEPLEGWWTNGHGATHRTEGCNYSPNDIDSLLPALRRTLGSLPIAGMDSWMRATQAALRDPGSPGSLRVGSLRYLKHINIHGYRTGPRLSPQSDSASFLKLRRTVKALKKPVWQTEWGPLGVGKGSDLDVALLMARQLVQHVSLLGAEAWLHWWAVQPVNPFWGAVRIPWKSPGPLDVVYLSKQFYATAHFTRFLTPGAKVLRVTNNCMHNVLAFYSFKASALGIVVVNQRPRNSTLAISVKGLECAGRCSVDEYRTSKVESLKPIKMGAAFSPTTRMGILASSVTTFVISKVPQYV